MDIPTWRDPIVPDFRRWCVKQALVFDIIPVGSRFSLQILPFLLPGCIVIQQVYRICIDRLLGSEELGNAEAERCTMFWERG